MRRAAVRGGVCAAGRHGRFGAERRPASRAPIPRRGDGACGRGAEIRAGAAVQTAARRPGQLCRTVGDRQREDRRRRRFLAAARRRRGLVQLRAHPPRFGRGRADRETLDGRRGRRARHADAGHPAHRRKHHLDGRAGDGRRHPADHLLRAPGRKIPLEDRDRVGSRKNPGPERTAAPVRLRPRADLGRLLHGDGRRRRLDAQRVHQRRRASHARRIRRHGADRSARAGALLSRGRKVNPRFRQTEKSPSRGDFFIPEVVFHE